MTEDGESNVEDRDRDRFTTEIRPPFNDLPVAYADVDPVPGLPPAITALEGAGSEGLGLRQHYSVRVVNAQGQVLFQTSTDADGTPLIAVPSNIGIRTMPTYDALAAQGIYDLGRGMRVFAGQRKEMFYIDLGSTFDTLNFRRNPPVLTNGEDADDTVNPFGLNDFQGLNINTIALEIPVASLPSLVGLYASTSRQRVEVRKPNGNVGHIVIGAPSIRPPHRIWGWIAVGIMGEPGEALLVGGSCGWDAEVQTQQLSARIGADTSARILPGIFQEDCRQVVLWGLRNGDAVTRFNTAASLGV